DDFRVFVGYRLLAIRQANDAQSPRGQRDAGMKVEPFFVRAAMDQSKRHPPDDFVRYSSLLSQINNACDTAHGAGSTFGATCGDHFPKLATSQALNLLPFFWRLSGSHITNQAASFKGYFITQRWPV